MEEQLRELTARLQTFEAQQNKQFEEIRNKVQITDSVHVDLLKKLGLYEQEQKAWKDGLVGAVGHEVGKVTGSLSELYKGVKDTIDRFEARIRNVEASSTQRSHKTLLNMKDMKPNVLEKDEQWRRWKSDVEDYAEETFVGMKEIMDKVKESEVVVEETWFANTGVDWWARGEMLWRFLKRYTGTDARRVVLGVSDDNGWEAWRKLHQQYEPGTVTREAMVMSKYTNMVNRKAKTPKETKALLIELNERAKRVEEVTGHPVEERHAMSVMAGILDPETSKHTAQYQGAKSSVETLKRKVMEFTNLVTSYADNRMDLDRLQGQTYEGEYDHLHEDEEDESQNLSAVGEKCFTCGGYGHYARECANNGTKGKGKGPKGKGKGEKGDGKGKGGKAEGKGGKGAGKAAAPLHGTCWTCNGPHFARDCPRTKPHKGGGKGEVRVLASVQHAATSTPASAGGVEKCRGTSGAPRSRALTISNRFEVLGDVEEEQEPKQPSENSWTQVGRRGRWRKSRGTLRSLVERAPEGVNSVDDQEWEELEMAVDSGATETVIGEHMLANIETREGIAFRKGVQYEVASGALIDNLGEKKFLGVSEEGTTRSITAQVCDVNKALLSVKRMVQAGNRIVFESAGGYIEDIGTGERLQLREQGGMYMLKMWVQRPFRGQAQ